MTRRSFCFAVILFSASPGAAMAGSVETWGKPGVSFDQYRRDAIECGTAVANADVRDEPEAKRFVQGFQNLDRENNTAVWVDKTDDKEFLYRRTDRLAMIHRAFQPQKNADRLQNKLSSNLQQCLRDRGYVMITLTPTQARTLARYKPGTLARHHYLHALASDPAIVAAQRKD